MGAIPGKGFQPAKARRQAAAANVFFLRHLPWTELWISSGRTICARGVDGKGISTLSCKRADVVQF